MDAYADDILVAACQAGNKKAYAVLVKRYYKDVFAMCLGMLGNVQNAEDIAQDAMLRGFLKIRKLRGSEQFGQWIVRIARNLCIDLLRRQKHAKRFLARQAAESRQRRNENHDDLEQALRRLPEELRLPLVMYYFDSKNAKTIAEKLNISHSGVCQRIRAGRKELHKLLTEAKNE